MIVRNAIVFIVCLLSFLTGCSQPTIFSDKALSDTFLTTSGDVVTFESILKENLGKIVVLDIWATWCKDCIVGMPDLKKLAEDHQDAAFVYISLDKDERSWKKGIERYELNEGQHYWSSNGWESEFFKSIELDWVPRYMIIDKEGKIKLYKAIKANDINIVNQIIALKDEK